VCVCGGGHTDDCESELACGSERENGRERAKVQLKQMKIAKFDVGDCFKSTSALTATLAELITHMCEKDEEEKKEQEWEE